VNLSRWPFRRLPCDETGRLIARLKQWNVGRAWAGSLDGLFHRDVGGVNLRLAEECKRRGDGLLVPVGTVNPKLPDWREDLRRCHEEYGMRAVRLHPNYHGYALDDPLFGELLGLAGERGLLVQLAVRMDDDRVQHRLMQVADVDVAPLAGALSEHPQVRFVLLNGLRTLRPDAIRELAAAGASFEISMLEGVGGIEKLLAALPAERLLFGSHLPLFNLESAVFKLRESQLTEAQIEAITHENAERLLEFP
jgi:hypothetical protein